MAEGAEDRESPVARELIDSVGRLANVVKRLDEDFYKKRTFWWSFSHGILYGIGTVIGATLIAGLALYLISQFHEVPYLGRILDNLANQAAQNLEQQQNVEQSVIQSLNNYSN